MVMIRALVETQGDGEMLWNVKNEGLFNPHGGDKLLAAKGTLLLKTGPSLIT